VEREGTPGWNAVADGRVRSLMEVLRELVLVAGRIRLIDTQMASTGGRTVPKNGGRSHV
jgi:hypothetical protein